MECDVMSKTEVLRENVRGLLKGRAMLYHVLHEELTDELGEARATDILKHVIYGRGATAGAGLRSFAPDDFAGLRDAFLAMVPDAEILFGLEARRCDGQGLELFFRRCPQKEAWLEAGLAPERVAALCGMAGRFDNGVFEAAGFDVSTKTWKPGSDGCCLLLVSTKNG